MIEVNKNTLAGAFGALGKLICRTSPLVLCKSIKVEAVEVRISDFNMADNTETGNNQQSAEGRESRGSRRNTGNISISTDEDITEAERVAQEVLADTGSTVSYRA